MPRQVALPPTLPPKLITREAAAAYPTTRIRNRAVMQLWPLGTLVRSGA